MEKTEVGTISDEALERLREEIGRESALPHLLIRFLTVPDAASARQSVVISALLIAGVLGVLLLIVGPAALAFIKGNAIYQHEDGSIIGGANMILLHLLDYLGGELLFGVIAAITFSIILAMVAGLTVTISSGAARDIYFSFKGSPQNKDDKTEIFVFRATAVFAVTVACFTSILLQKENIAYLSALAFAIAVAINFPMLMLAIYWEKLTRVGALCGGMAGLLAVLVLPVLGPTVWVQLLGNPAPVFPSDYSTLISAPFAFLVAITVSILDPEGLDEKKKYVGGEI